jgi:ABC transport system ATP-binding/permease protein
LQEMLAAYPGTLLLVSHDRDFLDRTVTSVIAFEGEGRWIEYAGGYSDMMAQRWAGVSAPARVASVPKAKAKGPSAPKPRAADPRKRLSPTEQHALKTAPARIESLREEIRRLEHLLGDPSFYGRDREAFAAAGACLAEVQAELVLAEEEWLRLELLREDVQGA